jgi:hypothetical protein
VRGDRGGRLVVSLWGRQWRRDELLARVGRLEQVAGVRLTEGGAGAELAYPAGPGTCVSEASTLDYQELTGPQAGFVEECYEHDMRPGPDGLVGAAVVNRAAGLGVFQRYDPATLPRHITWRQLGTVAYVVAMEPSTNRDAGRFDARERGELRYLAPGEERRYRLEVGALDGRDAIEAFAAGARELAVAPAAAAPAAAAAAGPG